MQELSSASSCRRAQLCQLMQKSSALLKEVSSCRSLTLRAHVGELTSVSSCRRAQLCSKRLAHAEELGHSSSSMTLPSKKGHNLGCRGPIWVI